VKVTQIFKIWIGLSLLVFASCMQSMNSNSNDDSFKPSPSIDTSTPEGLRYAAAMNIVTNKCINCHTHATWSAFTTEEAWIQNSSGRVIKNDSLNSPLYNRNRGSLGHGTKDMPLAAPDLTVDELNAIASWIDEMI
jgi:uncharacterized membrane protein